MIYKIITLSGKSFFLKHPISSEIKMDKDAPAHSLSISFALDNSIESSFKYFEDELSQIHIYDDRYKFITEMLVDEQKIDCSSGGIVFSLYARSRAALLIDNEANPIEYSRPSLNMIFSYHAKPFGFTEYNGKNKVFYSTFEVTKGISQWKVLENFSNSFSYKSPRVTLSNVIDFNCESKVSGIVFSNDLKNKNAVRYQSISYIYKRNENISKVYMRCTKGGSYSTVIKNDDALSRGIVRERYLNMVNETNRVYKAEKLIKNAVENCMEIKLLCSSGICLDLFDLVTIDDKLMGKKDGLCVSNIHYKLDGRGERCQISLFKPA